MANTIKLKRGSGSDPGASDLSVGEVAVRTDTGKLFTKKDDNSVTEIGVTALGDNDVTTSKIADDAVTYAKIQNVSATDRVLGRDSSGAGSIEEISPANLRTMINVEDGATADQTKSDIDALGIAASTAATLATARTIGGVSFDGSANIDLPGVNSSGSQDTSGSANKLTIGNSNTNSDFQIVFSTNGAGDGRSLAVDGTSNAFTYNPSSNNLTGGTFTGNLTGNVTGNTSGSSGSCTGNAATATALETARTIAGVSFDGTANISLNNNAITNGAGYITATLTEEQVEDYVGGMLTGNTETGITVTYQDSDGTIDFVVASQTDENFTTTLKNKLDGIAASATNVTNNNQLTNGAGYITSADGGNAATLDSLDSTAFLRANAADTASSEITFNGGITIDGKAAANVATLTDGSTITVNMNAGTHHSVTLGGNRTFGQPSNQNVGQSGSIFITQDGTGSRTASFHSDYKFVGGTAPTLSTAANAVDRIDYVIKASNVIHAVISLDVK